MADAYVKYQQAVVELAKHVVDGRHLRTQIAALRVVLDGLMAQAESLERKERVASLQYDAVEAMFAYHDAAPARHGLLGHEVLRLHNGGVVLPELRLEVRLSVMLDDGADGEWSRLTDARFNACSRSRMYPLPVDAESTVYSGHLVPDPAAWLQYKMLARLVIRTTRVAFGFSSRPEFPLTGPGGAASGIVQELEPHGVVLNEEYPDWIPATDLKWRFVLPLVYDLIVADRVAKSLEGL